MKYKNIEKANFISRPNRFIAIAELDGNEVVCHVKNTGRLRELLTPGVCVYIQKSDNPDRKTPYDLIAVEHEGKTINIDSQAPNKVFGEWLTSYFSDITKVKPEAKYKNSRFDFYVETKTRKIFIEIKGVTLKQNTTALFPDAPTERGVKHLEELCECVNDGYEAYVFFVIKMEDITQFSPNTKTHPQFADALIRAKEKGVNIKAVCCRVEADLLEINDFVKVCLEQN